MATDEGDQVLLGQAHGRATRLLAALTADADAFRAPTGTPACAEGATLCDKAADDARRLLAAFEAEHVAAPALPENKGLAL